MPQPSYGKVYPFVGANQAGDAEWRKLAGAWGDGIINDATGNSFKATRSASDRTIIVQLHELRMRGIDFEEIQTGGVDPTTTITLSAPSAGQVRTDRIVARYDPSVPSISIIGVEGSPVSSPGVPSPPALSRVAGGVWDLALYRLTGGNVASASLALIDDRSWIGAHYMVPTPATLTDQYATASLGSRAYTLSDGHQWVREMVGTTPTWIDLDGNNLTVWDASNGVAGGTGSLVPFDTPLAFGRARGRGFLSGSVQRGPTLGDLVAKTGADTVIGTLPAGYRPTNVRRFMCGGGSSQYPNLVSVFADGTVSARPNGIESKTWLALDPCSWPLS